MLYYPNTYMPAPAPNATSWNGQSADWSGEITPPAQGQLRQGSDTGRGGIAAVPNGGVGPGMTAGPAPNPGAGMPAPAGMPQGGQVLDLRSGLSNDAIQAPISRDESYLGSLKAMLARNLGAYIVATFLVGTQGTMSWDGILYDVGNDYLTIYQEARDRYVVSDYYSLKFMEFYDIQRRRRCAELLQEDGWQENGTINR